MTRDEQVPWHEVVVAELERLCKIYPKNGGWSDDNLAKMVLDAKIETIAILIKSTETQTGHRRIHAAWTRLTVTTNRASGHGVLEFLTKKISNK